MSAPIKEYYRKHDDFTRYLMTNKKRVDDLSTMFASNKQFFGRRVLDLACGGGVLGFVIEPAGCSYVGVDVNPDMVSAANRYASKVGSRNRFVLGDSRSTKISGVFDTITLVGNAIIHFDTADFVRILKNVKGNVRKGTHFIVDYRDVVSMLYTGDWGERYVEKRAGKVITSLRKGIDTVMGNIRVESVSNGHKNLEFTHAIWSPFIIEPIMEGFDWRLTKRKSLPKSNLWVDIYRRM